MFSANDKISTRQFQILLILEIFGVGFLILPRISAEFVSHEGFIAVLIGTAMAIICGFLMASLSNIFPEKSFFDYASKIISKPIAFLLALGLFLNIILHVSFELRLFSEIVKEVMLYNTPIWVISLLILLVSAYAAICGMELRARLAELLALIVFIPLIVVFSKAIFETNFSEVLPIFQNDAQGYLKGGFASFSVFAGLYVILLSYPYLNNKKKGRKATVSAIAVSGIFMAIITLITIARFGAIGVTKHRFPTLEMMNITTLPGSIIERQEALMMSFFVVALFAIINSGIFFSSVLTRSVVKKGKHFVYVFIILVSIFVISLLLNDASKIHEIRETLFTIFAITYMIIIPMLLLVIAKIRRLGEKSYD
ncbi:MAG: spore germination protein [Defluviitaleaceae bacterium]|nr:spore germination protein [Defluviitaleaceae bacterium]